jgi:soluble lytic murein transglycosylase-like protein
MWLKKPQSESPLIQHMKSVVLATYKGVSHKDAKKVVRLAVDEATKAGLDPKIVVAVIATESSFQPKAKSWYGAAGYMQVVPRLHKDKIKGRDIHEAKTNVEVGVKILASCYKRKKTDKAALACYNGSDSEASAQRYFAKVAKVHKTLSASL